MSSDLGIKAQGSSPGWGAKQVNHLHGFRVSGFFFAASPDAQTASVRGQDADRKRQHFGPGFGE